MDKRDNKNGVEKEKLDTESEVTKTDQTSKQPAKDKSIPKGKLKWSKEDELSSASAEERSKHTKQIQRKEKSDQKEDSSVDTKPLTQNKQYSIEDTLGPIEFKEYSIDPEEKEQTAKSNTEIGTEEKEQPKLKSDPKVKNATSVTQDTKPFVFSPDDKQKAKQKLPEKKDKSKQSQQNTKKLMREPKLKLAIKILWLPIVLVVVLLISLIVGHTVIGNQPASDIFDLDMWIHMYKLIFTK